MGILGAIGARVKESLFQVWGSIRERKTLAGDPARTRKKDPVGFVATRRTKLGLQIGLEIIHKGEPGFQELLGKSYFPDCVDTLQINWVIRPLTITQFAKLLELEPQEIRKIIPDADRLLTQARDVARQNSGDDSSPMTLLTNQEKYKLADLLLSGNPKIYTSGAWFDFNSVNLQNYFHVYPDGRGNGAFALGVAGT